MTITSKVLLVIMLILIMQPLVAQDEIEFDPQNIEARRTLGDQIFAINLGLMLPLFLANPDPQTGEESIVWGSNMSLGGAGSLHWGAFLDNSFNLGLEVALGFTVGPNGDIMAMVPIGLKISNYFRTGSVEIPIHLGIAANIMRYKSISYFGFVLKPGFSILFNATKDWSFGLNFIYWWAPEIYTDPSGTPPSTNTRFGNFLEITLSAMYNI